MTSTANPNERTIVLRVRYEFDRPSFSCPLCESYLTTGRTFTRKKCQKCGAIWKPVDGPIYMGREIGEREIVVVGTDVPQPHPRHLVVTVSLEPETTTASAVQMLREIANEIERTDILSGGWYPGGLWQTMGGGYA